MLYRRPRTIDGMKIQDNKILAFCSRMSIGNTYGLGYSMELHKIVLATESVIYAICLQVNNSKYSYLDWSANKDKVIKAYNKRRKQYNK